MLKRKWHVLTIAPDLPSAHALVEHLTAQGIACHVVPDSVVLGQGMPCRILVEPARANRANAIMSEGSFTDDELTFLATGVVSCDAAKE
jgi:hypothetical protein